MDPRFHFEWTYPWVVLVGMVIGYLVTSLPGTSGSETSLAIGIAATGAIIFRTVFRWYWWFKTPKTRGKGSSLARKHEYGQESSPHS